MPREVTHTARGPRKLTREDFENEKGNVAVCQCGLSGEYPFCDGAHRRADDEDPETLYKYVDGERRVVAAVEYAEAERGRTKRNESADDVTERGRTKRNESADDVTERGRTKRNESADDVTERGGDSADGV